MNDNAHVDETAVAVNAHVDETAVAVNAHVDETAVAVNADIDSGQWDELFALLVPELQAGVLEGRYSIVGPGEDDKPVVVDAKTGRWVKGTGRPLNANDPAYVGKTTAYRRSRAYNEALEALIPAWNGDSPDALTSLEELVAAAMKLAVPEPVHETVKCPECDTPVVFTLEAPPNQKMVEFLIKRLAGDATKTINQNTRSEEVISLISDQRILHQIEIVTISPEDRAARRREILDA